MNKKKKKHLSANPELVFVWPKKSSNYEKIKNIFIPLLQGIVIGFVVLDTLHLWPGEFLPNKLPTTLPPLLPPVKFKVIEPRWFDNS